MFFQKKTVTMEYKLIIFKICMHLLLQEQRPSPVDLVTHHRLQLSVDWVKDIVVVHGSGSKEIIAT